MPNLRLLQINNVHLTGSFENSFKELRWFCWRYCPLTCLPPSFRPPKLISLDMQCSNVNTLWVGQKHLNSLKILNASHSKFLTTTPDFGGVKMLEKLFLRGCSSLVRVHPSIGVLGNLVHLNLSQCSKLKRLPEQFGSMKGLQRLNTSCTGIDQLPDSIGHMARLVMLDLFRCRSLRSLPSSICNLSSLEYIVLVDCFNLKRLPLELGNMKSLQILDARNSAIEQLPDSVGHLSRLEILRLNNCKNLRNLPTSICNLRSLQDLWMGGCLNLKNLPEQLSKELEVLIVDNCSSLESLPDLPPDLRYCEESGCISLKKLSNVAASKCLVRLNLTNCRNLRITTIKESFLQGLLDRDSYDILFPCGAIPEWFSHQRTGSSVSFDMPPNLANNFIGMVPWAVYSSEEVCRSIQVVISNKTEGTKMLWNNYPWRNQKTCELHSWVSYIRKPISMKSQDRIEVVFEGNAKVERCGVYFLHNNTSTQIGRKRGRDIDVSEAISHLKRLKL